MADDVMLTVGGRKYGGWTDIEIAVGIDAVASSFRIGLTERWPGHSERWVIDAGSPAVVSIGGEPVITGYIDRLESWLSKDLHNVTITGRSKAADLVDCSAVNQPGSWLNRSLESIAADIAQPFGITIIAEAPTAPPLKRFALQQGESAWDAIARMLKQRGLIGVSRADGSVALVSPKPGAAAITLAEGRDLLEIRGEHDVSDRFSRYIAKGQASGDDQASGAVVAGPKGEASDPGAGRYRPLIVIAEDQASAASLAKRAEWEATVRAAKAQEATVVVNGWRQQGGALWTPMQLVRLRAPSAWIDDSVMAVSVIYRDDNHGQVAELRVGRPEAYTQLAIPEDAKPSSIIKQAPVAILGGRG